MRRLLFCSLLLMLGLHASSSDCLSKLVAQTVKSAPPPAPVVRVQTTPARSWSFLKFWTWSLSRPSQGILEDDPCCSLERQKSIDELKANAAINPKEPPNGADERIAQAPARDRDVIIPARYQAQTTESAISRSALAGEHGSTTAPRPSATGDIRAAPIATSTVEPTRGLASAAATNEQGKPASAASSSEAVAKSFGGAGLVGVEMIGPETINIGVSFCYEVVVRNTSAHNVVQVQVANDPPAESRLVSTEPVAENVNGRLTWNLGSLEAGAERRLKVVVQPAPKAELTTQSTVTFSVHSMLRTRILRPELTLAIKGGGEVPLGEKAGFQIDVSNIGTAAAEAVAVHVQLPAALTNQNGPAIDADIGTLPPNESKRIILETQTVASGSQSVRASATSTNAATVSEVATVVVTQPRLALKSSGPQKRIVNREAEFVVEVVNEGAATARNVCVVDSLPAGLEFIKADGATYEPRLRTVTWKLDALTPSEKRNLSFRVACRTPGDFVSRAVATGEPATPAQAESKLLVEGIPAMSLEVVDIDDPIEAGAETTYEIRVVNQGSAPAKGMQIIAVIPDGLTARSASGPAPYRIQGQQVIFDPLVQLAPRADAVFRIKVLCREAGDWRFKVQLTCEQMTLPVCEEESTRVYKD